MKSSIPSSKSQNSGFWDYLTDPFIDGYNTTKETVQLALEHDSKALNEWGESGFRFAIPHSEEERLERGGTISIGLNSMVGSLWFISAGAVEVSFSLYQGDFQVKPDVYHYGKLGKGGFFTNVGVSAGPFMKTTTARTVRYLDPDSETVMGASQTVFPGISVNGNYHSGQGYSGASLGFGLDAGLIPFDGYLYPLPQWIRK